MELWTNTPGLQVCHCVVDDCVLVSGVPPVLLGQQPQRKRLCAQRHALRQIHRPRAGAAAVSQCAQPAQLSIPCDQARPDLLQHCQVSLWRGWSLQVKHSETDAHTLYSVVGDHLTNTQPPQGLVTSTQPAVLCQIRLAMTTPQGEEALLPTYAVLTSANKHIAIVCAQENFDYMACKGKDANPAACLEQGKKVTKCVANLYVCLRWPRR